MDRCPLCRAHRESSFGGFRGEVNGGGSLSPADAAAAALGVGLAEELVIFLTSAPEASPSHSAIGPSASTSAAIPLSDTSLRLISGLLDPTFVSAEMFRDVVVASASRRDSDGI